MERRRKIPKLTDPDAERQVLGSLLVDPDCMAQISGLLAAEHFYLPEHQQLYAVIQEVAAGGPVNIDLVAAVLPQRPSQAPGQQGPGRTLLDDIPMAYLHELVTGVISPSAASTHARRIVKLAKRRLLFLIHGDRHYEYALDNIYRVAFILCQPGTKFLRLDEAEGRPVCVIQSPIRIEPLLAEFAQGLATVNARSYAEQIVKLLNLLHAADNGA